MGLPEEVRGFHPLLPMASADEHRLSAPVGQFTAWHPEAQHMGNAVNHTAQVDGACPADVQDLEAFELSPSHQGMRELNPRTVSFTPYLQIDVGCWSYQRNLAALM